MNGTPPRSHGRREERAKRSSFTRGILLPTEDYLHSEAVSGTLIFIAAAVALIWINSPFAESYTWLQKLPGTLRIGEFSIEHDLQHWVNDGFMTIFFFLVALEIKREVVFGTLSEKSKAAFPAAAAVGGMLFPVGIYLLFNVGSEGIRGWGIPMATDIAFAIAVISLASSRVPNEVKILLLAFAIIDDIGSILVIAVYYAGDLSMYAFKVAVFFLGVIVAARLGGIRSVGIYVLLGALFWAAILKSGIHATIAGVILGAITPFRSAVTPGEFARATKRRLPEITDAIRKDRTDDVEAKLGEVEESVLETESPLERIERLIRPWVNYMILPVFALLNAGVVLSASVLSEAVTHPVTLGVALGLIVGKPLGVLVFGWIATRLKIASLPDDVTWMHITGVAVLGGVGFTVALFVTQIAFGPGSGLVPFAQIAILSASILMGVLGYLLLLFSGTGKRSEAKGSQNDE